MLLKAWLKSIVVASVTVSATCLTDSVNGQVVIGGGGISIGIPGVGGVNVGIPARRGVVVAPYGIPYGGYSYSYGAPYRYGYGAMYGPISRYSARPITPNGYGPNGYGSSIALPTAGELRAMTDSDLLNATSSLVAQLQEDLNRFDTGDTWQRYLALPADALPPANDDGQVILNRESLVDALTRFDRTVANSRYVQISGLPSYSATHAALGEVVRRFETGDQAAPEPSGVVPPPLPTPPQSVAAGVVARTEQPYEPQSIEMRNLHAAPPSAATSSRAVDIASAVDQTRQELPAPPPSLVAPSNDPPGERSVLAR